MRELIVNTHQLANVVTIANPINIEELIKISEKKMPFNYCIAIGQFENPIKQFHKLIVSYANSILPEKNTSVNT
jgi:N-acetylgalactosamine-N,N'-diacetylbacillosaminyl-diphospho-undecaprenol 4-alpha-N-acetylgalactosaminyltransferase